MEHENTLALEAYATGNGFPSPDYATVAITDGFCSKLVELSDLCKAHGLTEVRIMAGPGNWGCFDGADVEGDLNLCMPELVVTPSSFWFVDLPKYGDFHVETRGIQIRDLLDKVKAGAGPYFFPDALVDTMKEQLRGAMA